MDLKLEYLKCLAQLVISKFRLKTNLEVSENSIKSCESILPYLTCYVNDIRIYINDDYEIAFSIEIKGTTLKILFKDDRTIDYLYKSGETKIEGNCWIVDNPEAIKAILNMLEY